MDAQKAFERFEKTGAGLLPVFLLAALAITATLSVVSLSNKIPKVPLELTEGVLNLGRLASYSIDLSNHTKQASEDGSESEGAQEARREIEESLPANEFTWIGSVQDSRQPHALGHVYISADRTIYAYFVLSTGLQLAGDSRFAVVLTSKTKDDRTIQTSSSQIFHIATPWSQTQVVSISGHLEKVITKLLETHRKQLGSEQMAELDSNIVEFERTQSARTAYWLIEQAPIKSSVVAEILGSEWRGESPILNALLLIGFCNTASDEYDHAALKAYLQNNGSSNDSKTEASSGFYVLHAMSNELHVAKMFPQSISQAEIDRRLQSEWLPATVKAGKTDMAQVEQLFMELTVGDPLALVGEIEKPFRAKIYQRSSTKNTNSAKNADSNVDPKEITK
jgi:hypothetical protein